MAANTVSYTPIQNASTLTRAAPRPTGHYDPDSYDSDRDYCREADLDAAAASTERRGYLPRPAARVYPSWSLCCNCGGEYYPEDIPAALRDCGQYGTCGDCRAEATSEMAAWAAGVAL